MSLFTSLCVILAILLKPLLLVARCVHFLRQHLVGKKISKIEALDDNNVFGKAGTSGSAFEKALKGRIVSVPTVMSSMQIRS